MALEKKLKSISATGFSKDGEENGSVYPNILEGFRTGQTVLVKSNIHDPLRLIILKIYTNEGRMILGSIKSMKPFDMSGYERELMPTIEAPEQDKPFETSEQAEQNTHEREPINAKRRILVDKLGHYYDDVNRLPVDADNASVRLIANLLTMIVNPDISRDGWLVNNDNFFIYDNDGALIKAE
jgi:hypothetical protein